MRGACFLGSFLIGLALAPSGLANAQLPLPVQKTDTLPAAQAVAPEAFEVATVKPTPAVTDGRTHINYPDGGGFSATNITVALLMQWAYDMPQKRILHAPEWFSSTRFDFQGKSDAETDAALRQMPPEQARTRKRRMVQRLIEERFRMEVHRETQLLPALDLLTAKGGPHLQDSVSDGQKFNTGRTYVNGTGMTTAALAEQLSQTLDEVVVDKTGLTGRYDIRLQWAADDAVDAAAPSLPVALEEQLGLRLVKAKELLPVLVVEHAELPAAN